MTRDRAIDPLAEYRRVNVGGTRVVLDAMHQTGARRLILVSSVKAVGVALARGSPPWQDDVEPHPSDPYGVSKLEAERLVLDQAAGAGIRATIIRLPLVYGPGVRANMLALFRLVNRGFPLPFGRVENRRSLAYVGNAVSAIASLLEVDDGPGPYFVSDGHDLSTPELIRAIARAMNMRAPLFPVPVSSLRLTRDIARLLAQILPTSALADAMERLVESLAVDSSTLWRILGHSPPFTVDEGMAATAAWYRSREGARGRA